MNGRSATAEWIENYLFWRRGDSDYTLKQCHWFLRLIMETFACRVAETLDVGPNVLQRRRIA